MWRSGGRGWLNHKLRLYVFFLTWFNCTVENSACTSGETAVFKIAARNFESRGWICPQVCSLCRFETHREYAGPSGQSWTVSLTVAADLERSKCGQDFPAHFGPRGPSWGTSLVKTGLSKALGHFSGRVIRDQEWQICVEIKLWKRTFYFWRNLSQGNSGDTKPL
jgi:hypothetical protein